MVGSTHDIFTYFKVINDLQITIPCYMKLFIIVGILLKLTMESVKA